MNRLVVTGEYIDMQGSDRYSMDESGAGMLTSYSEMQSQDSLMLT